MYVILPIIDVSQRLYEHVNQLLTHAPSKAYTTLSYSTAVSFCQSLADFFISERLYWTDQPVYDVWIDQQLQEVFPWWELPIDSIPVTVHRIAAHHRFCEWVYREAIDPYECVLRDLIREIITPETQWCLWYTTPVNDDLMLSRGEDYRIVEFEQRVLSDQIPLGRQGREQIFKTHRSYRH